jgi:Methyltransferase domain
MPAGGLHGAKARLRRSAPLRAAARAAVSLSGLAPRALKHIPGNPAYAAYSRHGFHLLRKHYYVPIPDEHDLAGYWAATSELVGVDLNERYALALLDEVFPRYCGDFAEAFPVTADAGGEGRFHLINGTFMAVDADVYYSFIRHFEPRRIVEIGSGQSTLLAAETIARAGLGTRLTAIDPYPPDYVGAAAVEVRAERVQDVDLGVFTELETNDILFIDSTHVLRAGGDVQREYCEILPRLREGVLVHVHDISLPKPYPRVYFEVERWFWNEQYVLQAFLAFNSRFEVVWPATAMTMRHRERLDAVFPSLRTMNELFPSAEPSSFWMRVR